MSITIQTFPIYTNPTNFHKLLTKLVRMERINIRFSPAYSLIPTSCERNSYAVSQQSATALQSRDKRETTDSQFRKLAEFKLEALVCQRRWFYFGSSGSTNRYSNRTTGLSLVLTMLNVFVYFNH